MIVTHFHQQEETKVLPKVPPFKTTEEDPRQLDLQFGLHPAQNLAEDSGVAS